eukprot:1466487-Prymnesium_polylepis.1
MASASVGPRLARALRPLRPPLFAGVTRGSSPCPQLCRAVTAEPSGGSGFPPCKTLSRTLSRAARLLCRRMPRTS